MKQITQFIKPARWLFILFTIAVISPYILGKLNFWESTQATPSSSASSYRAPVESAQALRLSFSNAVKQAAPAVVSIHSKKELPRNLHPLFRDPFFRYFFGDPGNLPQEAQQGIGSGVIINDKGYILTNNHVINEADEIEIKLLDGRKTTAKVVGTDPESDLAILKIDLSDLPVIPIGSSDHLEVGDVVLAIGNPFGVGQTVTQGIISATQRTHLGINTFENFIQTDAAINPGNSGGALTDSQGNLIGINNAIFTRSGGYQGIGFAIPVDLAKEVMEQLIEYGHVTRGWLGITVRDLNQELRESLSYPKGEGTVIAGVIRGGPAFKAGIRPGDIIISVDEKETQSASDVLKVTSKLKPDSAYPISVVREGETHDFRVVVGKRPVKKPKSKEAAKENESP